MKTQHVGQSNPNIFIDTSHFDRSKKFSNKNSTYQLK